jgi:CheY-like chemotaxis protein
MTAAVLVVDDNATHASLVRDVVTGCGHEAIVALDGNEALFRIRQRGYELVITDLRMPGMDGLELIERLRAADPNMAIIALTAFAAAETGRRALQAGAGAYLSKPFRPSELQEKIAFLLKRRETNLSIDRLRRAVDAHLRGTKGERR